MLITTIQLSTTISSLAPFKVQCLATKSDQQEFVLLHFELVKVMEPSIWGGSNSMEKWVFGWFKFWQGLLSSAMKSIRRAEENLGLLLVLMGSSKKNIRSSLTLSWSVCANQSWNLVQVMPTTKAKVVRDDY